MILHFLLNYFWYCFYVQIIVVVLLDYLPFLVDDWDYVYEIVSFYWEGCYCSCIFSWFLLRDSELSIGDGTFEGVSIGALGAVTFLAEAAGFMLVEATISIPAMRKVSALKYNINDSIKIHASFFSFFFWREFVLFFYFVLFIFLIY